VSILLEDVTPSVVAELGETGEADAPGPIFFEVLAHHAVEGRIVFTERGEETGAEVIRYRGLDLHTISMCLRVSVAQRRIKSRRSGRRRGALGFPPRFRRSCFIFRSEPDFQVHARLKDRRRQPKLGGDYTEDHDHPVFAR
jgi:hypothetical protein